MAKKPPPMTSDYAWQDVSQVRIGVSVSKAIKKVTDPPRLIYQISLADWKLVEGNGAHAIRHMSGFHSAYLALKLTDSRN